MSRYIFSLFICTFLAVFQATAQQELGLQLLPRAMQRQQINPAFMNEKKISFSLPSFNVNAAHSGFALADLIRPIPGSDSLEIAVPYVLAKMKDQNHARLNGQVDIFNFSLRLLNLQLSLSASSRFDAYVNYPKALPSLIWNGNAHYLDQDLELGPDFQFSAWQEIALGGAFSLGNKLQLGARLKYLIGIADLSVGSHQATFTTYSDYYQLRLLADYQLNASMFDLGSISDVTDLSDLEPSLDFRPVSGNQGFAIDLGAQFKPTEKLALAASITDLGAIFWTDKVKNYDAGGIIRFDGVDLSPLVTGDSMNWDAVLDTMVESLEITETQNRYKTGLPTKAYVSATISPIKSLRLSGIFHTEFYRGRVFPAIAVGASKDLGKIFTGGLMYSVRNGQFDLIGAQLLLKLGPTVFFLVSDNVLAFVRPFHSQQAHLRWGLNFTFL